MRWYAVAHFTLYDPGVINVPDGFLESNIITNQAKIKKLFVSRTRPTVRKRCDSKPDLWMNFEKKKFPYLPTHRWNGGSGAGNEHIFKGGLSAYHHWCCGFESRSGWGVQHYMIKFVSDLRQIGGFPRVLRFPPPIKLTSTI